MSTPRMILAGAALTVALAADVVQAAAEKVATRLTRDRRRGV